MQCFSNLRETHQLSLGLWKGNIFGCSFSQNNQTLAGRGGGGRQAPLRSYTGMKSITAKFDRLAHCMTFKLLQNCRSPNQSSGWINPRESFAFARANRNEFFFQDLDRLNSSRVWIGTSTAKLTYAQRCVFDFFKRFPENAWQLQLHAMYDIQSPSLSRTSDLKLNAILSGQVSNIENTYAIRWCRAASTQRFTPHLLQELPLDFCGIHLPMSRGNSRRKSEGRQGPYYSHVSRQRPLFPQC